MEKKDSPLNARKRSGDLNRRRKGLGLFLSLMVFLTVSSFAQAQNIRVSGTVTDDQGNLLPGVSVVIVGTTTGVSTGRDGKYSINAPEGSTLNFSFIGYADIEEAIGSRTTIDVMMREDMQQLDEVVVIGYQTIRRRDLTGSVASVTGKDLVTAPVANVAQALQGKLPGVNVISQDGRPDASVSIRVRGGGSVSQSNDPLILVDGVSVSSLSDIPSDQVESVDVLKDASSTAIYGARGANGVILVTTKGAKEGAISISYNGYAKFNTPNKYLDALDPYDYLAYVWANAAANGEAYLTPFEKLYGLGNYKGSNTGGIESYRNTPTYNMQKEIYNSSFSHNHDLSVTGGTDKTRVRFSFNYMDEDGMKVNSYTRRANVSLKVVQKLYDNVDLGLDMRYVNTETVSSETTSSSSGSILSYSYRFRPIAYEDIRGDKNALKTGNIEQYGKNSMWDTYSPVSRTLDYDPLKLRDHLLGTASLNWGIIEGLTYHTDFTLSKTWRNNKTWSGATYNNYLDGEGNKLYAGNVDWEKEQEWNLRWTNTLSYERLFGEIHRFNVLVGHEVTDSGGEGMRIRANYFPANFTKDNAFAMINQYDTLDGTNSAIISSSEEIPNRILSFFGRLNYTLKDRYLFTFTFRADGSSKFAPSKRWGYFPAAAFAWRLSDEPFMDASSEWLDNLKVRVSYGEVGNDAIDSRLWSQSWSSETETGYKQTINNALQPAYDLSSTEMANPDLKWETTITRNIGVDFSFLRGRLSGSVDAYWNSTEDLLMKTTVPGITGFTSTYANIGETSNKGIELSLSGLIFENKDWSIRAGANINFNKSRVEELADNVTGLYGTRWSGSSLYPGSDYILQEGQPVGLVRGLVYDGVYTTDDFNYNNGMYTLKDGVVDLASSVIQVLHGVTDGTHRPTGQRAYPGVPKFRDLDGSGTVGDEDLTVIGNMNPKHTGGFNVNVTFRNFDLGMYFNWSYGNDIYNANKLATLVGDKEAGVYENKLSLVKDSYKIYDIQNGQLVRLNTPEELNAANKNASLPLPNYENGIVSSLGIEDGSYLRLNTLTLGYTLPKSLVEKMKIQNLRIYGSIYNLFTITGYSGLDPEVNANPDINNQAYPTTGLDWGAYPRARQFVVGLNLTF